MALADWFASQSLGLQIMVLAMVFDPLGAALGYLVLPELLGVEPVIGAVYGLVAAGLPLSLFIATHEQT